MYGQITKFREDMGVGVIDAEDGCKYRFAKDEILNEVDPLIGEGADFLIVASRPRQIILMSGSTWTAFGALAARVANDRG